MPPDAAHPLPAPPGPPEIALHSFAGRVRLFLVLLTFFLVVTNLLNFVLLGRMLESHREETVERIRVRSDWILGRLGETEVRRSLERFRDERVLPEITVRSSLLRTASLYWLELVSPDGVPLLGTRPADPRATAAHLSELSPAQRERLLGGEIIVRGERDVGDPDYASMDAYRPILSSGGELLGVLILSHDVSELAFLERAFRWNLWAQSAGVLILLALVLLFSRWLLRPLQLVQRAAASPAPPGAPAEEDSTGFLVATYQKIISELQEKEQELRRLREADRDRARRLQRLNETILGSIVSGVVTVAPDGRIQDVNPAALQIFRMDRRDLAGKPYREGLGRFRELAERVAGCLEGGKTFRREEVRIPVPGEGALDLGISVSPLRSPDGGPSGALCLLTDLTEVKTLQRQVERREMLAGLGELSAGIAHEFRNALSTIQGYAQLLERRDEAREYALAIEEEVRSLRQVVDDFLRFANPTRLVLTAVPLGDLLREIAEEASAKGAPVEVTGEFPVVRGDETLLRRTFLNLARNAVEAVPEGREGRVAIRGEILGDHARILVSDNGEGIAPENLPRIFHPFFTTKKKGTGLGLALVQKVILHHNGTIDVESRPGEGTVFRVTLPLRVPEEAGDAPDAPHGPTPGKG